MSADNYYLVRKDGERFVVSCGFVSDEVRPPAHPTDPRFDTFEAATAYAASQYSEYGVLLDDELSAERCSAPPPEGRG